ncbi:MAG: toxin-antitoxin system YwqK family antitoxin [Flavobacteriales bacterium]
MQRLGQISLELVNKSVLFTISLLAYLNVFSQASSAENSMLLPDSVVTLETQPGRIKVHNYYGSRCVIFEYYKDTLKSCSSYINGIPDGVCLDFYSNGNVRYLTSYEAGVRKGLCLQYYSNGIIESIGSIDGRRDGTTFIEITEDTETGDKILRSFKSSNWDRVGIWFFYTRDGKLERTEFYN